MNEPKSEVFLIDCLEYMKTIPDKYFSLSICDPPYGIGVNKMTLGNGKNKINRGVNNWDCNIQTASYFTELCRISKNQIIWGGNYMTEYLKPSRCWIIWDKGTGDNDYADAELAWTSFDQVIKIFKKTWVGANAKNENDRIHPTEKPTQLYKWLLKNYAKPGDTIFDSHAGSMSSVIACIDAGLPIVACEIDRDYYEAGKKRVKNHLAQLDMFIERPEIIWH